MKIITEAISRLELSVFPSKCKICGAPLKSGERVICNSCIKEFERHSGAKCPVCGKFYFSESAKDLICGECLKSRPKFEIHRSAGIYEGKLRETILIFKYSGYEHLSKILAKFLVENIQDVWDGECIVPIPSHRKKLRERGFDHIYLIAKEVGKIKKIEVRKILRKTRYTLPQAGLPRSARLKNVRGSFSIRKAYPCKKVVLIDDVWTTGSTIREATSILKKNGYIVKAATVARTV